MSDDQTPPNSELNQADELAVLKQRAQMMGIDFSNNIKVETLRKKIQDKLEAADKAEAEAARDLDEDEQAQADGEAHNALTGSRSPKKSLRDELIETQTRLVRCRITNMDPKDKDLHGEVFTVGNEYIGTIRKFVPYGEATDDGYHIPFCIYQMLEEKRFLNIRTVKDTRTGVNRTEQKWAKKFAIEILEPLTPEELERLAAAQIAAGSVEGAAEEYMA